MEYDNVVAYNVKYIECQNYSSILFCYCVVFYHSITKQTADFDTYYSING